MSDQDETSVIPLTTEELAVGTREHATGKVRVRTVVETQEAWVDELLAREEFEIERRAVGRLVDEAPAVRQEGDLLIVPVLEEVLVVEKRLRLTEEIVLRRVRREERHREPVVLRRGRAVVERAAPAATDEGEPERGAS
jgi:uncharacterized protein (TIGR02271 family)